MNLRGRRVIAVALSTTLLVAACGRGDDRSAAVDPAQLSGGTLHVASVGDVDALDPLIAYSAESWQVIRATTRQLVTYAGNKDGIGKDTEVVPDLAESWDISPDRKTYTFHLRDNINFSGASTRPITAQDFVYAVKRFPDPNAQVSAITYYNALFEGFQGVCRRVRQGAHRGSCRGQELHRQSRHQRAESRGRQDLTADADPAGQ